MPGHASAVNATEPTQALPDGRPIKWIFSEITADSFRWLDYVRDHDGSDWQLEQEMRVTRRR